ncbi:hypothetical protein, partial [Donghicola eburneus]|uniref:hypothetical protein n=1 Tax=Donghicola eburneus TaxID=393278 RepID=UPI0008E4BC42
MRFQIGGTARANGAAAATAGLRQMPEHQRLALRVFSKPGGIANLLSPDRAERKLCLSGGHFGSVAFPEVE